MKYIQFDEKRPLDLTLVGRITIDFNPVDYYKSLEDNTTFRKYLGGSPANIAVGLSRLGKKCGFFGRVSGDRFGDFVTDYFEREGIDTSRIRRCEHGEKMGLTFTQILNEQESSALMYRDNVADLQLDVSDIDEEYIRQSKAVLISGTSLSVSPSREAALKVLSLAKQTDTPVIFDIDYRRDSWNSRDEMGIYLGLAAGQADVVLGSREEYDLAAEMVRPNMNDAETASYWQKRGVKIVVIEHGKEGSAAYTGDGQDFSIKPFPIKRLKGFGGGDGYASAFLYGLLEGWEMIDCLEFGSASASLLVASHSCSDSMPDAGTIRKYIDDCKREYGELVARV